MTEETERYKHKLHFIGVGGTLDEIRHFQWLTWQVFRGYLENETQTTLLDIGASEGYFRKISQVQYTGLDLTPDSPDVIQADFLSYETDQQYDALLFCHSLEHIIDTVTGLRKAYEFLKPGGLLFIACPLGTTSWAWAYTGHYHVFEPATFNALLVELGFKIKDSLKVCLRDEKVELWTVAQKGEK